MQALLRSTTHAKVPYEALRVVFERGVLESLLLVCNEQRQKSEGKITAEIRPSAVVDRQHLVNVCHRTDQLEENKEAEVMWMKEKLRLYTVSLTCRSETVPGLAIVVTRHRPNRRPRFFDAVSSRFLISRTKYIFVRLFVRP